MNDLAEIINRFSTSGVFDERGTRFGKILNAILPFTEGNIVEIGAGFGESTVFLLEAAKKYRRKVLVIDPFEDGWDNMPEDYRYPYSVFLEKTKGYDNLIICKKSSQEPSSELKISEYMPIAFAFVDGLQFLENVKRDLTLMGRHGASVICVDDFERTNAKCQVPQAVKEFTELGVYHTVQTERQNIEGYLIRK